MGLILPIVGLGTPTPSYEVRNLIAKPISSNLYPQLGIRSQLPFPIIVGVSISMQGVFMGKERPKEFLPAIILQLVGRPFRDNIVGGDWPTINRNVGLLSNYRLPHEHLLPTSLCKQGIRQLACYVQTLCDPLLLHWYAPWHPTNLPLPSCPKLL